MFVLEILMDPPSGLTSLVRLSLRQCRRRDAAVRSLAPVINSSETIPITEAAAIVRVDAREIRSSQRVSRVF